MAGALNLKMKVQNMISDMNGTDLNFIDDLLSKNYRYNGRYSSVDDNKKWLDGLRFRYNPLNLSVPVMVCEGNKVAVQWELEIDNFQGHGHGYIKGTNIITFDAAGLIESINQDDLSGAHHFISDSGEIVEVIRK